MARRKPPAEPLPDFMAGTDAKSPELVVITHPWWDGYRDCPAELDTAITVEDAKRFHEELSAAIASARLAVAEQQAAARKAAGEALEGVLDGIFGVRGES